MNTAILSLVCSFSWILIGFINIKMKLFWIAALNFCAAGFFALAGWFHFLAALR